MTTDLDDITTRLIVCMKAAAATVPDETPPWDPTPRLAPHPKPTATSPRHVGRSRWRVGNM